MAQQIVEAGARVEFVVAYSRRPPKWSAQRFDMSEQGASDTSVWTSSDSKPLLRLQAQPPELPWVQTTC